MQWFQQSYKLTVPALAVALVAGSFTMFGAVGAGFAAAPCNEDDLVGGGFPGISDRPNPTNLGWDVGKGQCNGSFTTTLVPGFPGGELELGLRIEERSQGQVTRMGANEYQVELGKDPTTSSPKIRTWWNFHHSIAYNGIISDLDALTFKITTHVGNNQPALPEFDMLFPALRGAIHARNGHVNPGDNPTPAFSDFYQTSTNPEFAPWFTNPGDADDNPTGVFDYDEEGAWLMTLTAERDGRTASVSICVHTPNAQCFPDHLACHSVKDVQRVYGIEVDVEDSFTSQEGLKVKKAKEVCVTADKNGEGVLDDPVAFVCYDVKKPRKKHSYYGRHNKSEKFDVGVQNQFTDGQPLRVEEDVHRICVPSRILR